MPNELLPSDHLPIVLLGRKLREWAFQAVTKVGFPPQRTWAHAFQLLFEDVQGLFRMFHGTWRLLRPRSGLETCRNVGGVAALGAHRAGELCQAALSANVARSNGGAIDMHVEHRSTLHVHATELKVYRHYRRRMAYTYRGSMR